MLIELNEAQQKLAARIFDANQAHYGQQAYGASDELIKSIGADGFAAELAVVEALGITNHTPSFIGSDKPDVGNYDVRQTQYSKGKLILHPNDKDDRITILVTGKSPVFILRGWIRNKDGKQERFWGTFPNNPDRPAFIIPQYDLNSMDTIPDE